MHVGDHALDVSGIDSSPGAVLDLFALEVDFIAEDAERLIVHDFLLKAAGLLWNPDVDRAQSFRKEVAACTR